MIPAVGREGDTQRANQLLPIMISESGQKKECNIQYHSVPRWLYVYGSRFGIIPRELLNDVGNSRGTPL